jgi:predicted AAA+ superfamily ATPase
MQRCLDDLIRASLPRELVLLTGPQQVGKTTLARRPMQGVAPRVV